MKKLLLLSALMAAGAVTYAQTGTGSIMLGADIGYTSTTTSVKIDPAPPVAPTDAKSSTMTFNVMGGYFIMDGLAVGLGINYGSNTTPGNWTDPTGKEWTWDNKTSGFGIKLFGRKYFEVSDKFKMWGQASFNYGSGTTTSSSGTTITPAAPPLPAVYGVKANPDATTTDMGLNITPGFTYFAADNWGIDFSLANLLGYNSHSSKITAAAPATGSMETTTSDIGININTFTPTIGLSYYIGK